MSSSALRVVVIGNGMVGQRLVDDVLARTGDGAPPVELTVIGAEPVPAYDRVALSSYFDGATAEDLTIADPGAMDAAGVELRLGAEVSAIDREAKTVTLAGGEAVAYDHLVLATGSAPFVPPIAGAERPGCFVYRTLDDLTAIEAWARAEDCNIGVVVGGGLLGLEAANALRLLGLETHVVEMADRLMPQQLDGPAAAMLGRHVAELDVTCHLGFATAEIVGHEDYPSSPVAALNRTDDDPLPADMVVFSAGIRPRHQLAQEAGLAVGERGGVVIDDHCLTSDPDISAIGEVACHAGRVYGLVGPGYAMAAAVASRLTGGDGVFEGADTSTKLKLLGVDVAGFGTTADDDERVEFSDPESGVHRRVSLSGGQVTGGVLVGDLSNYDALHAMAMGTMATADVAKLVIPADLAGGAVSVELPDEAQLCSCNNVSRGACKDAVAAGNHNMADLKACTNAGTGCGGCVPDLAKLLMAELDALGIDAKRSLCAHFDHTRQELFDLIRFHGHRTWQDVVSAHGQGRGCEICRPAVGSILASLSNGYVLGGDQATLQDTNDHALANMQRNGTYSVVPRVPGGEITPDQLIALGEIANEFGLYAKITGAQRVDLLGAQLHQLPDIWQKVIDAGMESGHAYGKALRTVKSCVGDTWCRYGVQDAVTMAIEVERRYRGLRAPHKLKGGVSGCTRECAEAQSKDFGIIATEVGWNLYLCGNGGRTPRHAQLFATDLSDEELITYLDRFLMFYIRTADRLERTAPWFQSLEGGMDYLKSVIVDDVLGICDELEVDMARHVDQYRCEWTETLADPERLRHFVEFVNAPEENSTPVWISERGQRVPAR